MDTERALAKLTLSLRITGRRPDGYHELDAEMVSIDFADTLTFSPGDRLEVVDHCLVREDARAIAVPTGDDNLVRRALRSVGRRAAVTLHKRIPPGAGLGGGSADAAAVLRWAGCDDRLVAANLGADVAFCVAGGRARVRGIGEIIDPLPFQAGTPYTLLIPPFGVSTKAAYGAWDDLGGPGGEGPNDLEPAVLALEPRLVSWRARLAEATGATPVLAGSGSAWFVAGAHESVKGAMVVRTAAPLGG